jgi:hypothetical protein
MGPVDHSPAVVPLVLAEDGDPVACLQGDPLRQVNVVRNEHRVPGGCLHDEPLVAGTLVVIGQNPAHLSRYIDHDSGNLFGSCFFGRQGIRGRIVWDQRTRNQVMPDQSRHQDPGQKDQPLLEGRGLTNAAFSSHGIAFVEGPYIWSGIIPGISLIPTPFELIRENSCDISIPGLFRGVKKPGDVPQELSPAKELRTPIKDEYRTVTKNIMVKPSYMEWRQTLCETNMNRTTLLDIQKAPKAKGFGPGPLDRVYGRLTSKAVTAFQDSMKR